MALDKETSRKRVMWDDPFLHIHKGDEIEIRIGIIARPGYKHDIRAMEIENLSIGTVIRSSMAGSMMSEPITTFNPPIRGHVENIQVTNNTYFDFIENEPGVSKFEGS